MTRDDITIVEENVHLKHYIFDLVRCIDEGVPVANYFANGQGDDALLNAEKYVADSIQKRVFFGGITKCKFKVGDRLIDKGAPQRGIKRLRDMVEIIIGVDEDDNYYVSNGVLMDGNGYPRVFPVSYVNRNFELYDKEA